MVGKLMKHEFIRTRTTLALTGLIGLLIVGAGALLAMVAPRVAFLPFSIGLIITVVFPFAIQLYLGVDMYRSSYGRRGYFTHALPVKGSTLVLTKTLFMVLASLIALAWAGLLLWISGWTGEKLGAWSLDEAVGGVRMLAEAQPGLFWFMVINMLGMFLVAVSYYVFSVTVGSEAWINKSGGLGPVLTYVILYVALQIVGFLSLLVPPSYNLGADTWSWGIPLVAMIKDADTAGVPLAAFLFTYPAAIVLVWRSVVSVSKKLELR